MVGTNLSSGTKTFITNFCKKLEHAKLDENIHIFISNHYLKELEINKNIKVKYIIKSNLLNHSLFRILWMQFILPFELKLLKINKLYSPMNIGPLFLKLFNIKLILSLHSNLPWLYFSKMPGTKTRNLFTKFFMQFSIKACDHLIVPSNNAKNEIMKILNIYPKKISSIYLGVDDKFLKKEKSTNLIKDFDYKNYILSVLSCVKYHDIINLLRGFKLVKLKDNSNLKFVLVMQILDKKYFKEVQKFIQQNFLEGEIVILSNIENEYLIDLYKKANLYIFTSMCEVFGLTSLEAMSQGCPVLLSKSSSLPEINSDSADYFNPNDPNSIKDSMEKVLSNLKYRNDLVIKGNTHFKKFSWENTVRETLKIFNI